MFLSFILVLVTRLQMFFFTTQVIHVDRRFLVNEKRWNTHEQYPNRDCYITRANCLPTGSDPEPGEEVRGGHDTQRQDGRGADGGEL